MERKFALFDIDKTLIRGDSLFALYFYGAKKWPVYWLWLPVIPFAGLLYALRILPVERVKRIFYAPLRRFSEGILRISSTGTYSPARSPSPWSGCAPPAGRVSIFCS